jgi:hypothetical protein
MWRRSSQSNHCQRYGACNSPLCTLKDDFPAHPAAQAIDVYSYFTDRFYGVKDPRPIIPHDREFSSVPTDETPSEEALAIPDPPKSEVPAETTQPTVEETPVSVAEQLQTLAQESSANEQAQIEPVDARMSEEEKEKEDDSEPFADILDTPKDKKRYSANPLPQQPPEQTS